MQHLIMDGSTAQSLFKHEGTLIWGTNERESEGTERTYMETWLLCPPRQFPANSGNVECILHPCQHNNNFIRVNSRPELAFIRV